MRVMKCFGALMITAMLAGVVSCGGKKKVEETQAGGLEAAVESTAMSFDPAGSDSGNISGLSTINFEYDRASLTTEARKLLAENANWINANPGVTVQVEGHCDSRGSVEYNLALGERRAKSVKSYLQSLGVDPKRVTIISYGKEKPVEDGDSDDAFAKNRRANFVPLPN